MCSSDLKKMNDKQRNELIKFANENIIKEILDGYEDFERVLNNSNEYKTLRSGVELIHDKFKDILAKEGGLGSVVSVAQWFPPQFAIFAVCGMLLSCFILLALPRKAKREK